MVSSNYTFRQFLLDEAILRKNLQEFAHKQMDDLLSPEYNSEPNYFVWYDPWEYIEDGL